MNRRRWPAFVETEPHPDDVAPPWSEHVQGVSCGHGQWYVAQAERLWRIPMDLDLGRATENDRGVRTAGLPEPGVEHLGDCDVHGDRVYVAMEGTDPPRVGVFDPELEYLGSAVARAQGTQLPWCAVDPVTGLLYSSGFHTGRLHAYRMRWRRSGLELEHAGEVGLCTDAAEPLHVRRVQGGAFSPAGHLFITSDTRGGGLLGIDVQTGRRGMQLPVPFEPDWPDENVIEGLAVVDLTDGRVPWMRGVVHVLVFDARGPGPDYVWLRHYDVVGEDERVNLLRRDQSLCQPEP